MTTLAPAFFGALAARDLPNVAGQVTVLNLAHRADSLGGNHHSPMKFSTASRDDHRLRALTMAGWVALLVAFVALRLIRGEAIINMDELIPLKLAEAMTARGSLDPNFATADLGPMQYNSYVFYFYNIVSFFAIKAAHWLGVPPLGLLRVLNLILQLLAIALASDALRRNGVDRLGCLFVAALIAVAPGVVQDAYMARPESLIYFLVALLIWVLALEAPMRLRLAMAGLVIGLGIAVKVTFATSAVLVAMPLSASWRERTGREWAALGAILLLGTALGFCIGAPYALIHPEVFFNGLDVLAQQYRLGHPPHSLPEYQLLAQAGWIARYFLELYGPLPLLALAAPIWLHDTARRWTLWLAMSWMILAIYFATKAVFYERNFAHGLLPLLMAAAFGVSGFKHQRWRIAVAVLLLLPLTYWSTQIALAVRSGLGPQKYENANGLHVSHRLGLAELSRDVPVTCGTIAVVDYNDPWTRAHVSQLEQNGFTLVGRYQGRFAHLVTSTLHTGFDVGAYYLKCPRQ
jgi:hypothetical protein